MVFKAAFRLAGLVVEGFMALGLNGLWVFRH